MVGVPHAGLHCSGCGCLAMHVFVSRLRYWGTFQAGWDSGGCYGIWLLLAYCFKKAAVADAVTHQHHKTQ